MGEPTSPPFAAVPAPETGSSICSAGCMTATMNCPLTMFANRSLQPIQRAARSTRLGALSLQISLVWFALNAAGCLRFGYDKHGNSHDAGSKDAGPASGGGRGGSGSGAGGSGGSGSGGNAGTSLDSGSHDAAAGSGDGGDDESDAGTIDTRPDAGATEVPDAGNLDAGPVTSPLCPERPGVAFCDGFEDPDFTRWEYPVENNGTLTRSTAHAHSGMTSLLATTGPPAAGTEARWATIALANQKSGDAWMRFYNWVPGTVVVTQHFSVGVMSEIVMPYRGFELRIRPSVVDINASDTVFPGTLEFPRDRWVCVELHVLIHPSAGIYEAYLDGMLAVRSPPVNTLPADGFTAAEVGVHYADPAQGPVEVYVDDVAVGTSRIPCD
jgi:hypothetical protein